MDDVWLLSAELVAAILRIGGRREAADVMLRLVAEVRALRTERDALLRVADCARRERTERAAWLASLPEGSCASPPPPRALTDAERETGAALDAVDGRKDVTRG